MRCQPVGCQLAAGQPVAKQKGPGEGSGSGVRVIAAGRQRSQGSGRVRQHLRLPRASGQQRTTVRHTQTSLAEDGTLRGVISIRCRKAAKDRYLGGPVASAPLQTDRWFFRVFQSAPDLVTALLLPREGDAEGPLRLSTAKAADTIYRWRRSPRMSGCGWGRHACPGSCADFWHSRSAGRPSCRHARNFWS